jgi:hypothetical protein
VSGNFAVIPIQNGQLPTAQAPLYTSPQVTYVKQLLLYNENAASQTIQLWLIPFGGTAALIRQLVLAQNESAEVLEEAESFTLSAGDAIAAATTTAAAVDYTVLGVQET